MKKYLITSPEFYTQESETFAEKLEAQIQKHQPDFLLYRDKENANYAELAKTFIAVCKEHQGVKCFLHQDPLLAHQLDAGGVHLNSTQFDKIAKAKELGLEVIVSTHTHDEVNEVQSLGADYVTYSPIFPSPNKGIPKGIEDLKLIVKSLNIKIFALGGIVDKVQIKAVEDAKAFGFASIRYFF
ncbi:thiamine phosphate synthase [Sulfurimonas marina]|uniref:Thiamine phosphate synthase n=1 Tax=Sulfurimonas marina TaxID=2590551 RepID=A0A7M1AVV1_9BACT|nr:thiamine phosphate synthase [Sulfurimonas marina]QOP41534.1 thiamine phosphate synthase [Sulfurimonas marina]